VNLVHDLIAVLGSTPAVVADVDVYPYFAVVERGSASIRTPMRVQELIRRRPRPSASERVAQVRGKVRREAARVARAMRRG
jgi:hypothetical protein